MLPRFFGIVRRGDGHNHIINHFPIFLLLYTELSFGVRRPMPVLYYTNTTGNNKFSFLPHTSKYTLNKKTKKKNGSRAKRKSNFLFSLCENLFIFLLLFVSLAILATPIKQSRVYNLLFSACAKFCTVFSFILTALCVYK